MSTHSITVHAHMAPRLPSAANEGRAPADENLHIAERFEILFIEAGEANGWTFDEQVLKDSAALWEACPVFVDHALWGHSVRDLGGVLANVNFSSEFNGLVAELHPCGSSAEVVREAARIMFGDGPFPNLGFSADVIFEADDSNRVAAIVEPRSVDLVVEPAFATGFIRQLNEKGVVMPDRTSKNDDALRATLHAQDAALQAEAGRELVTLKLRNAELPEAARRDIHARFDGRAFEPSELEDAVRAWQDSLAAITAASEIRGPARVSGMFDTRDQLQAAVDDLVGAPREQGAENLKVAEFQGVREAYIHLTGDRDFVGGYFPDRVQFTHTSASFPALLTNSLNKALAREWDTLGRAGYNWWEKIVTVEHFNTLNTVTWMLFGTVGSLPTVAENGEYTELKIGDSAETSSFVKRGGYIGLSLEAMDKDDTRKLHAIPRELANAALREISAQVAALFTSNAGAGPTLSDTGALFNNTAVSTKGGHKNLLTTALGTDFTAWDAVGAAMFNQPMLIASEDGYWGTGKACGIEPKYCLVPRTLRAQAEALFIPRWASTIDAGIAAKGGPTYGGYVQPIVVPEWTDATDWAAVADPAVMPGIMLGERFGLLPQIFVAGSETDPAMFSNDESRIKVRHFLAVGVADFRPLHKSNVAG